MKIEIDGHRYYGLDEATKIIGSLKSSTVLTYAKNMKADTPPAKINLGQAAFISENATQKILDKLAHDEVKRKALEVTVEGKVFKTQKEAATYLGVPSNYVSGYIKVKQAFKAKAEEVIEEKVEEPEKPKEEHVDHKGKELPYEGKNLLIVGGSPFYARWRAFLKKQGINLVTFESRKGSTNVDVLRGVIRKADFVLIAQNYVSHNTYKQTKNLAKETGTPCMNFTNFGNKTIISSLDELSKQQEQ